MAGTNLSPQKRGGLVQKRRQKVSSAEAAVRIVTVTIELMREIPFDEVSVRRITDRADLNPSTVLRNFGTVENLYNEVSKELLRRITDRLGPELNDAALFDSDVILRTRLMAWLLANGTDPSLIAPSGGDQSVQRMVDDVQGRTKVSRRTATAFNEILSYGAEGFVVFHDVHVDSPELRRDALQLMTMIEKHLPALEAKLGWDKEHETS